MAWAQGWGGVVVAPSSLLWILASACLPLGFGGVALCQVDWTHPGWFPSHWARLGATLGGAVGEPAWDTVTLGTLLMPVGGFWCSWCFSPLAGSFLAGGDDWGGAFFSLLGFFAPCVVAREVPPLTDVSLRRCM